ncbi:CusA/CzcA family heavy metal efflux RND transporter [Ferrovibrio sp. MS7]|uniref:efflux RND transporter permease subunit n=1 Tax=Ferrovibrio plantarum TaxID=3119164 RepID=UPI003134C759
MSQLGRIVEYSLAQRLFVLLLTIMLIAGGAYAFRQLPIDAYPDVSPVQVKVIMKAPGMTPEEVEARITAPIEIEMLGIPNKRIVRSVTKYALTDVTIDFEEGVDIYWARNQVAERLANISKDLPTGISGGLAPITTPLGEMFMFTIEGGDLSLTERRTLLDWVIRPALRTLPGVADVNALGGLVRSFEVVPNNAAMSAYGVSVEKLRKAIEANNRNDGAGRLSEGEEVLLVRAEGNIATLDDLSAIVVASNGSSVVRLGDVATVKIGSVTRYGVVTKDGKGEAVQGLVLGLRGANAREVVNAVQQKLTELQPTLPPGVTIETFYDRSSLVDRAVGTVSKALLEAIVLVLILLLLFLGDWRAAFVVALTLPLAALATFLLMRWTGLSANLMSLGGLAIAIGMLIDAAIVVVENVVSHLEHDRGAANAPLLNTIFRATKEVVVPVASGIAIIIIVFLPLLTLQGLEGKLFVPVALAIVFALGSSLLLSLTVLPVLASFILKRKGHSDPWLVRKASGIYLPTLRWALNHERPVLIVGAALLLATAGVFTQIGKTFMPTMDEGSIIVGIEKLPSVSLEETAAIDLKIHQMLMREVPEVISIVARAGSDELGLDPMGLNQTDTYLILKPEAEWRQQDKEWMMSELRRALNQLPGISYSFTQPIDMRVQEMIIGVRGDVAVKIFGPDIPTLNRLAEQITTRLQGVSGSEDVFTTLNEGVQYLSVKVDRMSAGRYGLSVDDIADSLRAQIVGQDLGIVLEDGRRTPIILRGTEAIRQSPALFSNLNIILDDGRSIPLSSVATLERIDGSVKIDRESGLRMAIVQSNVQGRDLVGFVEEAKAAVAKDVPLPAGYSLKWGGQFENQQRAAARLQIVVPIALGLIFIILFATFSSVRQAVLVFVNIPFAMIGGVFALWISGEYLSVPASVGFIALLGIAVLNGLVLVSYFNQLREEGVAQAILVVDGALRRMRPVLLTASITAFGLLPLLFATGPGSEVQRPLAIVVIGGIVSSTLLTLVVLPVLYRRFGTSSREAIA